MQVEIGWYKGHLLLAISYVFYPGILAHSPEALFLCVDAVGLNLSALTKT
jgi:hypothetical protein